MAKNITILGAGESGTGAALLAKVLGHNPFVSDAGIVSEPFKSQLKKAQVPYEEGRHSPRALKTDLAIKSPGIPFTAPIVKELKSLNIEVIDEIEFAYRNTDAKIIAVTGTNGKTTTTLLTYHLLKVAGFNVGLAGNVGQSLAKQVAQQKYEYYVVEMSSFQIDGIVNMKPHIAILLNITPDHMERYEYSLQKYTKSKFGLIKNMQADDHFITYRDNQLIQEELDQRSIVPALHSVSLKNEEGAAYYKNNTLCTDTIRVPQRETSLLGLHNAINMLCAIKAAELLAVPEDKIKEGLRTFKNAAHRLEYVDSINDVDFINDSKATNVDAVKYALESFSEPLVWIAGGVDKGNDYSMIMELVNKKVKTLICLGKDNTKLREAFHSQIINLLEKNDMKEAVRSSLEYATAHDVVLLSPACASFDLFKNYEDRGNQFKQAVKELKEEFQNKSLKQ